MYIETKLTRTSDIIDAINLKFDRRNRLVFISGNFNVIHPGHLRLFNFAKECGDYLVVGVVSDNSTNTLIPSAMRVEGVSALSVVDCVVLIPESVERFIEVCKPDIVLKGKEYSNRHNTEQSIVDGYGGRLIFGAGEVRFSSMDLLKRELLESSHSPIKRPAEYYARHQISNGRLIELLKRFQKLKVVVIGDLIVDEYISCDALGMSREDPTIVVTPLSVDRFVGGAGAVANHAHSLGSEVAFLSVTGKDEAGEFASERLAGNGIATDFLVDESRPTTLKQRYRANGKTLLRVSHLREHDISSDFIRALLERLKSHLVGADLVIFSDFNYGVLPQLLVDQIIKKCTEHGVPMVADSQSSSQMGNIARFRGMLLITPTEYEARLAVKNNATSLTILGEDLKEEANASHVFVTLGAEGLLVCSEQSSIGNSFTDQLPALNMSPKDVSGAGDCLLTTASLALIAGANIWESAYLGSYAAACQVGRIGNIPLTINELITELSK